MIRGHRLAAGADHRLAHVTPNFTWSFGGIASGKTAVPEDVASRLSNGRLIICLATSPARSIDAETGTRTASHRGRRPSTWVTIEASCDLATAFADAPMTGFFDVILREDIGVPVLSNFSCFRPC